MLARPAGSGVLAGRPPAVSGPLHLRDINFGCPWPVRDNAHLDAARAHALRWMVDLGIAGDAAANEDRYRRWKLGECAGWFYPAADAPGLAVAACLMGWYFSPFDDQFDGELGRDPQRAVELIGAMTAVLDVPDATAPDGSLPVVLGFADIWRRSRRGMSPAWRLRAAHHWKSYLTGQLAEVVNRRHDRVPDVPSHLRQRVMTTSCEVLIDLIEPMNRIELPPYAWQMPVLDELRQLASEVIVMCNDLVSAEKEEAAGDDNNLLLILERQEGLTRPEAVERMRSMTHERYARFLRLEERVPDIEDVLDDSGCEALHRWVRGLQAMVAGDNEWEHTSERYVMPDEAIAPPPPPVFRLPGPFGIGTASTRLANRFSPPGARGRE